MSEDSFIQHLRKLRKQHGLSQAEMGKVLGLKSGQVVSNWERNYRGFVPIGALQKMIQVFKLDESQMLEMYIQYRKNIVAREITSQLKKRR